MMLIHMTSYVMAKNSIRFIFTFPLLALLVGCSTAPPQQHTISPHQQTSKVDQEESIYVVRSGDTLSAIAHQFSVTALQLQYRNNIADPHNLKIGTRLAIPNESQQVPPSFANKTPFIWPLKKLDVSSEFGSRNNRHKGIDLRAPKGTKLYASADGLVHFVGQQNGYGKVVIIKHAGDIQTFYAHNNKNLVTKGQRVKQGEVIGTVGRTGNATGNHVHFEFIRGKQHLNPRHYMSH
jgi:murein DD-endopeptidase MepM/ murein hydrolase activator NlpD